VIRRRRAQVPRTRPHPFRRDWTVAPDYRIEDPICRCGSRRSASVHRDVPSPRIADVARLAAGDDTEDEEPTMLESERATWEARDRAAAQAIDDVTNLHGKPVDGVYRKRTRRRLRRVAALLLLAGITVGALAGATAALVLDLYLMWRRR